MKLDVSDSITWLGEGWCENAGEKSKTQPPLTRATIVLPLCRIPSGIKKSVFVLVEMWIVVCLTALAMLPNSWGRQQSCRCSQKCHVMGDGLQPWGLVGDVRPVKSVRAGGDGVGIKEL